jgi:hypothetical protein
MVSGPQARKISQWFNGLRSKSSAQGNGEFATSFEKSP